MKIGSAARESIDVVEGDYALKLKGILYQGGILPGLAILGQFNPLEDDHQYGIPFSARPDTLHVIYKYTAEDDIGFFNIKLSKYYSGARSVVILDVKGSVPPENTWKYVALPLSTGYTKADSPDSLSINITTSSGLNSAKVGSTLIVDGIYFTYKGSVSTFSGADIKQIVGKLYPTLSSDIINFTTSQDILGTIWLIFDSNGNLTLRGKTERELSIDISELSSGAHTFILLDSQGNQIYRNKFIKI